MARGLWGKIEWVRGQPEHIRMRYALGCLAVSMAFIIGIWLLSLQESFQSVSRDIPAADEKGAALLPPGKTPSLNDLLKQAEPLRADGQDEKTGQQYFQEQFPTRTEPADEGAPEAQSTP